MSETEARSVAEKVAAARDVASNVLRAWKKQNVIYSEDDPGQVVDAALKAQQKEIEKLQLQLTAWQDQYNRLWEPARNMVDFLDYAGSWWISDHRESLEEAVYPKYEGDETSQKDSETIIALESRH